MTSAPSGIYNAVMKLSYVVPVGFCGTVADFFADMGFSTTQIKRFKYGGSICVNGVPVTVRRFLQVGDRLDLFWQSASPSVVPSDVPADVLFADEYLYVANKPYGIAVHPDRAHKTDTLGNRLAALFGQNFRLHVVTRLDKTTSGLVLGALDEITAKLLTDAQQSGKIRKTYYALVEGELMGCGKIELPLLRLDDKNKTVADAGGKPSVSEYFAQKSFGGVTLVKLIPHTGRTHQLRAHLSAIGHPIVGDVLYGAKPNKRVCLHCAELQLTHPYTEKPLNFFIPADFDDCIVGN